MSKAKSGCSCCMPPLLHQYLRFYLFSRASDSTVGEYDGVAVVELDRFSTVPPFHIGLTAWKMYLVESLNSGAFTTLPVSRPPIALHAAVSFRSPMASKITPRSLSCMFLPRLEDPKCHLSRIGFVHTQRRYVWHRSLIFLTNTYRSPGT